jgi:endonuclease/exonuclease/phosphatase family metal-dependent hydrolase
LRIVSVNAWGGALHPALVSWLPSSGADVVCLQEVTRTPGLSGWTHFSDGDHVLPQRADLLWDVRQALPAHQPIFVAFDAGPVRDKSDGRHRQEFGMATFVAPSLPVVELSSAFIHGDFVDHAEWPASGRPRAALAVRTVSADRPGWIIQMHGLRDAVGKGDTPARLAQAARLAAFVTRLRRPGDLVVLCGDFNLLPDSATFEILAAAGLTDLVGTADTRTSHYRKPVRHASYMLVSDVSAVARFEVMSSPEVSDHRALILDLQPPLLPTA